MKRVLVAGATGYLGKFMVKKFKESGYYVRALVRNIKKLETEGKFLEPAVNKFVDDIFVGEITKPRTLIGLMDGIDIVFSSIGKTHQNDKLTFMDVDYRGNKNLLDLAVSEGIEKFIYVAMLKDMRFRDLDVVKAKEKFVDELERSGLNYIVMRPNGFFSDMAEFFKMAKSGYILLIGNGEKKINPISADDLAEYCLKNIDRNRVELTVGGKYIYSYNEISRIAFSILGKKERIIHIPRFLVKPTIPIVKVFSKNLGLFVDFLYTVLTNDIITEEKFGNNNLEEFFIKLNENIEILKQ